MAPLNLRHFVAVGSALLFVTLGAAFFLVYQNVGIMRDQINADFNEQQLILARQATAQIQAHLDDITAEFASVRRHLPGMPPPVAEEALVAAFERTRTKGLTALGVFDRKTGAPAGPCVPACAPIAAQRLVCADAPDGSAALGPTWTEVGDADRTVEGAFCAGLPTGEGPTALVARLNVSQLMARAIGSIRSGKTGYAWAIDQTGNFLYHPEQDFIGRNAFEARQQRQPYISFSQINRRSTAS